MPLPGQVSVSDDFRVQSRDQKGLRTRLEEKRNLTRPDNPSELTPNVPDWLQVSHPLEAIANRENKYASRLRDQSRSVDQLGTSANDAVASGVEYKRREAAARALAKAQAMQERNTEWMNGLGNFDFDFGSGGEGATGRRAKVIAMGKRLLGQPYQWGGGHGNLRIGPVDCSGLVRYAFGKAGFSNVPGVSQTQMRWGKRAPISKLLPGDLVGRGSPATHVAIYLGNGKILEAQKSGTRVHIRSIKGASGWWGIHLDY